MQELLKAKANPNIGASNGATPLHWAAQQGHIEAVQLLLQYQADIHATTNSWLTDSVFGKASGQTAMHWAAERGHLDIVLCLLKEGSLASAEDERGTTPADAAGDHAEMRRIVKEEEKKKYICLSFLVPSQGFAAEYSRFSKLWKREERS